MNEKDEYIIDLEWTNKYDGRGKWVTREIPIGKQIIGLYCNTAKYDFSIPCVGFILWESPIDGSV